MNLLYFCAARKNIYIDTIILLTSLLPLDRSYDIVVFLDDRLDGWWNRRRLRRAGLTSHRLARRTAWDRWFNKLRVFEYPGIDRYDKILYLDSDILVNLPLEQMFAIDFPEDKLCVVRETEDLTHHCWSLEGLPYTEEELTFMSTHGLGGFNSGTMLLHRNAAMERHFEATLQFGEGHAKEHSTFFMDQSVLNYYFNRQAAVDYGLTPHVRLWPERNEPYPDRLIHFLGGPGDARRKYREMRAYVERFMGTA